METSATSGRDENKRDNEHTLEGRNRLAPDLSGTIKGKRIKKTKCPHQERSSKRKNRPEKKKNPGKKRQIAAMARPSGGKGKTMIKGEWVKWEQGPSNRRGNELGKGRVCILRSGKQRQCDLKNFGGGGGIRWTETNWPRKTRLLKIRSPLEQKGVLGKRVSEGGKNQGVSFVKIRGEKEVN